MSVQVEPLYKNDEKTVEEKAWEEEDERAWWGKRYC